MKVTRKRLEALRSLKQELDTLCNKYMKMPRTQEEADTYGDYNFGVKRTKVVRGQSDYRSKKVEEKITAKSKRLEKEVLILEDYLDTVEDSEMRDILRLHYAEGLSQEEIGKRKGYSRSAIATKIKTFFEEEQL